jgi:hypothetical protein
MGTKIPAQALINPAKGRAHETMAWKGLRGACILANPFAV